MGKEESPLDSVEHQENGQKPESQPSWTTLHIRRSTAVAVALVIALAALFLCVGSLFSGCSPTASTGTPQAPAIETSGNETGGAHTHDWTVTYQTVHHDAVTHTETMDPEYADETTYHTVCNDCGQVIDGIADQHIKETGHSGYSTNVPITDEVLVSEGYTQEVVDTPAYDETVADALVCTLCGETRPIDGTVQ